MDPFGQSFPSGAELAQALSGKCELLTRVSPIIFLLHNFECFHRILQRLHRGRRGRRQESDGGRGSDEGCYRHWQRGRPRHSRCQETRGRPGGFRGQGNRERTEFLLIGRCCWWSIWYWSLDCPLHARASLAVGTSYSISLLVRIWWSVTCYETPSCNIYSPFPASQHILPMEIEMVDFIAK